jgi:hypothetical protein
VFPVRQELNIYVEFALILPLSEGQAGEDEASSKKAIFSYDRPMGTKLFSK